MQCHWTSKAPLELKKVSGRWGHSFFIKLQMWFKALFLLALNLLSRAETVDYFIFAGDEKNPLI